MKGLKNLFIVPLIIILLSSCSPQKDVKIRLLDAKMASGVNDKYVPINITHVFPEGTQKAFLWFSWKAAAKDIKIIARWTYVRDNVPVLNYPFIIPREEGQGSIALTMPESKALPAGVYRVSLELEKRELTSLTFKVLAKQ